MANLGNLCVVYSLMCCRLYLRGACSQRGVVVPGRAAERAVPAGVAAAAHLHHPGRDPAGSAGRAAAAAGGPAAPTTPRHAQHRLRRGQYPYPTNWGRYNIFFFMLS
jgi:hypothetical protein